MTKLQLAMILLTGAPLAGRGMEPIYSESFDGITTDGCSVSGLMSAPFDSSPTIVHWGTFSVGFGDNGCAASSIGFQKVPGLGDESAIRHDDLQRANSGSTEINTVSQVFTESEFWWTMAVRVEDGGGVPDGDFIVLPMLFSPNNFRQIFDISFVANSVTGDRLVIGGSTLSLHNNGMPRTEIPLPLWNGPNAWASEPGFHLIAFRFKIHTVNEGSFLVYVDPTTPFAAPHASVGGIDNLRAGVADAIGFGRHWQAASPLANGNAILTSSRVAYWSGGASLADILAHYPELNAPPAAAAGWEAYE